MPAYLIADTHVTNSDQYEEYKRHAAPLIERFGGRYLARGGKHEVLEGDWEPHRLVVLEFPDVASLKAWYDSAEYAPIKAIRQGASQCRLIMLKGI
ncbi:DUF1330 domain-containing protein [Inquilinus limosus]|uniref:DUF1330 domain-containing protein n=1 Tax=Inquilinus limosus TaxID=171674 RepID=UPI003F181FE4